MVPKTPTEAKAMGLRWYIPTQPCKAGHIAKRNVSNRQCRACVDAKHKARRAVDPDCYRAKEKARRCRDLVKARRLSRESRSRNRDKRAAYDAERYPRESAIRKARAVDWIRAHPEYRAARCAMQRAKRKRATPWWLTKAQRAEMVGFYLEARARPGSWEVDHIVPIAGKKVCGLHVPWNLQVVPKAVNRSKGNRHETDGGWIGDGEPRAGDGGGR